MTAESIERGQIKIFDAEMAIQYQQLVKSIVLGLMKAFETVDKLNGLKLRDSLRISKKRIHVTI